MTTFFSNAHAYICALGYHYSQNYIFEEICDFDRLKDLLSGRTYNLECYQGLIYYYYCVQD
ncbi:Uncharacterised protein [Legionella hackeliae]|uniref:Uncharacterized protein n=1 Tax=Legionella hackeliae TaxID=449 RepID=A0A0A8UVB3_LEGHA|nr:hypothetical protein Lhac_1859 [Legionella hackeliae]CEK10704.1 protein of unknown function [Legionella hackeliae]STX47452.1 Uncharacterised protein [Legionella hackeliae]